MEAIMKKSIISLVAIVFLVVTTGTAFAWNNRYAHSRPSHHYRGHGHHYGNADAFWAILGASVLTGCLISYIASPPPPPAVVYAGPGPVVLSAPPRVVVKEYAYAPPPQPIAVDRVVVTAQELNVRSGPGFNHAIAGYVVQGEALQVISHTPGWLYVRTASGLNGWVAANYTAPQVVPLG
jgi:uncharacterized protein YgiM (DUF1202 family)